MKLKLPNFTLITVIGSPSYNDLSILAIDRCMSMVEFGQVKILSCIENTHKYAECIKIPEVTKEGYNRFFVEELADYISTDFCLTVQHDGFIVDPTRWNISFTKYDYIGAPWPDSTYINPVGNGGFSIRSKKFLDISSTLTYNPNIQFQPHIAAGVIATSEDWFLCVHNYYYMIEQGIKFPNKILASQFSMEHPLDFKHFDRNDLSTYKSFGFHGEFNKAGMALLTQDI